MTTEERFQRIEDDLARWTALATQDRAEYIAWKRDMQSRVEATWMAIERYAEENRKAAEENRKAADRHSREMADMRQQMAARDEVMDQRIGELVSAIGELNQ